MESIAERVARLTFEDKQRAREFAATMSMMTDNGIAHNKKDYTFYIFCDGSSLTWWGKDKGVTHVSTN